MSTTRENGFVLSRVVPAGQVEPYDKTQREGRTAQQGSLGDIEDVGRPLDKRVRAVQTRSPLGIEEELAPEGSTGLGGVAVAVWAADQRSVLGDRAVPVAMADGAVGIGSSDLETGPHLIELLAEWDVGYIAEQVMVFGQFLLGPKICEIDR